MITRRHFLSFCAVTAATPCAVSAQTIIDPFNITVTKARCDAVLDSNEILH
jgi:hypothetical protein